MTENREPEAQRWAERAEADLRAAGHQIGGARRRVIELLAKQPCALTALEMDRRLPAGRASIYRALEHLEGLHLVQRIDVGGDAAGYERVDAGHHHHIVCERCGRLEPFSDDALEQTIGAISRATSFEVSTHDVTLRGACPDCAAAGA